MAKLSIDSELRASIDALIEGVMPELDFGEAWDSSGATSWDDYTATLALWIVHASGWAFDRLVLLYAAARLAGTGAFDEATLQRMVDKAA